MSRSFGTNSGSLESLKRRTRCGAKPCARQMRWAEETLTPAALAIAAPVQCVASNIEIEPGTSRGRLRDGAEARGCTGDRGGRYAGSWAERAGYAAVARGASTATIT